MMGASRPVNGADLRRACGRFATGVAVVTARAETVVVGMTINSFSSVSLDPPLVLWSIRNSARSRDIFERAGAFAISILSSEQELVARRFSAGNADAFDGTDTLPSPTGLPFIAGAIAHLDCTTYDVRDGGDHRILIGNVDSLAVHEGCPLLFYDGRILSRLAPIASSVTP